MKKSNKKENSNEYVTKTDLNTSLSQLKEEIVVAIKGTSEELKETIEEKDRKFHVLHEDTNHKISLLAEGQQMIIERLDRETDEIKGILTNHEHRITSLEIKDR